MASQASIVLRVVGPVAVLVIVAVGLLLAPGPGWSGGPRWGPAHAYLLPRSAFNITDHNLTYTTNGVYLASIAVGSFDVRLVSELVGNGRLSLDRTEAELGLGPVPAGPEESNITPLLIVQEFDTGLLRIEYLPFPMNDTYGYIVFDGNIEPAGSSPFAGHTLELRYVASAPPVPAYRLSQPYGAVTGNLTATWDGSPLAPELGIAWSTFGAFYAYGRYSDSFGAGGMFANVSTAAS
jgi:hypothetical protein